MLLHQLASLFVMEVFALIGYLAMGFGSLSYSFLALVTPPLAAGQCTLFALYICLSLPQVARRLDEQKEKGHIKNKPISYELKHERCRAISHCITLIRITSGSAVSQRSLLHQTTLTLHAVYHLSLPLARLYC